MVSNLSTAVTIFLFNITVPRLIGEDGVAAISMRIAGVPGIWLAVPCAEFLALILSVVCLRRNKAAYGFGNIANELEEEGL